MAAKSRNRNVNTVQAVTTGSTLRMEPAKSSRQPKPKSVVIVSSEEYVGGFFDFLREHAVVALALGFVIATQIQTLAKQLIASFIDPLFTLLFGEAMSQRTFTLHFHGRVAQFGWGMFVYNVLDVLFVLITIYVVVKVFKLEKLDGSKNKKGSKDDDSL